MTRTKNIIDKLQALGWKPEIDLENSYKRMIEQMKITVTEEGENTHANNTTYHGRRYRISIRWWN